MNKQALHVSSYIDRHVYMPLFYNKTNYQKIKVSNDINLVMFRSELTNLPCHARYHKSMPDRLPWFLFAFDLVFCEIEN